MKILISATLLALVVTRPVLADPVWDPTEIARLSQQAGQLAANLSVTVEALQSFDKLARQFGAAGKRAFISDTPSALQSYAALQADDSPAADASALPAPGVSSATQQQIRQVWQGAYRRVTSEGMAVSQVANRDAGSAVSRSSALARTVSTSQDLRGDLQANSAVGLAVLQELGSIHAVLALLLEQQSISRLSTSNVGGTGS